MKRLLAVTLLALGACASPTPAPEPIQAMAPSTPEQNYAQAMAQFDVYKAQPGCSKKHVIACKDPGVVKEITILANRAKASLDAGDTEAANTQIAALSNRIAVETR